MANSELNFSVRLQMLTDQFNQNLHQARTAFSDLTSNITTQMSRLTADSAKAESALTGMLAAPPDHLTSAITTATAQLNRLSVGANLTESQIQAAFTAAANHVTRLTNEVNDATAHLQQLQRTNASPASIEQARLRVENLTTQLRHAETASNEFSTAIAQAGTRAAQTAQAATASMERLLGIRTNNTINAEINAVNQALVQLNTRLQQGAVSQQEFNRLSQAGQARLNALQAELNGTVVATQRTAAATDGLSGIYGRLQGVLATLGVGFSVMELVKVSDAYTALSGRIKLASQTQEEYQAAMKGVVDIAQQTYAPLTNTAELYYKVSTATKAMGLTQEQVLGVTKTINQAVQLSGSSAESAAAAVMQFTQSLASGVFRGEEFNSVAEQAPYLLNVMAKSLGVSTGELRNMAGQGKLTADVVIKALQDQGAAVDQAFKNAPTTIGNAIQNVKNSFTVFIGEMNNATGTANDVVKALGFVSTHMSELAAAFITAAKVAIAYKAINLATTFYEKAQAAQAAAVAVRNEAVAVTQNTGALGANAGAARTAAAAQAQYDTAAQTAGAQAASAATATAGRFTSLTAGVMGFTSKLGLVGAYATAAYIGIDLLKQGGELLGKGMGYVVTQLDGTAAATRKLEEDAKNHAAHQAVRTEDEKRMQAAIAKGHEDIAFKAAESSKTIIKEFDGVIKKGGDVKKALEEINLNLSKPVDIQQSILALNDLRNQSKITADDMRNKIQGSLNGVDLLVFKTNMQAGIGAVSDKLADAKLKVAELQLALLNAGGAGSEAGNKINLKLNEQKKLVAELEKAHNQSVQQMAIAEDAILGEAIKRTGFSIEILKGQMSKQSQSNANDVAILADNFDLLKSRGIDAGTALQGSLKKSIQDADNPKALQVLQGQISQLKDKLGEPYTKGLMIDLKQRTIEVNNEMDKLKAGVNSTEEAFHAFGQKTPKEMAVAAESTRASLDVMQKSGQASTGQLQEAWKQWASEAIAANKGVVTGAIEAEAASLGMAKKVSENGTITFEKTKIDATNMSKYVLGLIDEFGNQTEKGAKLAQESNSRVASSASAIGGAYQNAARLSVQGLEEISKKLNYLDVENSKKKEQWAKESASRDEVNRASVGKMFEESSKYSTLTGMENFLKEAGLSQEKAMEQAQMLMNQFGKDGRMNWAKANGIAEGVPTTIQQMIAYKGPGAYLLDIAEKIRYNQIALDRQTAIVEQNKQASANRTVNVNLNFDGQSLPMTIDADKEQLFNDFINRLQSDSKRQPH